MIHSLHHLRIWQLLMATGFLLTACTEPTPEAQQEKPIAQPHHDSVSASPQPATDTAFTFAADSVTIASRALNEMSYKAAIEYKLEKKILAFPEEKKDTKLVPCAGNGFLQTVHTAYAEHRPLKLSPDVIWLLICQGFSLHVNTEHKKLEPLLFINEKPKALTLRNDSLVNNKAAEWAKAVQMLSGEVHKYTKDSLGKWMVPAFQTTGPIEKSCYEITLLESAQKTFEYNMESGCGIPQITLSGAPEDWDWIYTHVDDLRTYDLNEWVDALKPVLHEFCEARRGRINKAFWKVIYKDIHYYGASSISGWIIKFFPYIKDFDYFENDDRYTYHYVRNMYLAGEDYRLSTLSTQVIPDGISKINVHWTLYPPFGNEKRHMQLYAGFVGMKQNKNTKELSPEICWAVAKANAPAVAQDYYNQTPVKQVHHEESISTLLSDHLVSMPVYAPERFKSYKESIAFLTASLHDTLIQKVPSLKPFRVQFVVTWGGTIAQVKFPDKILNASEQAQVKQLLLHLPHGWKPAVCRDTQVFLNNDFFEGNCKSNYKVTLRL